MCLSSTRPLILNKDETFSSERLPICSLRWMFIYLLIRFFSCLWPKCSWVCQMDALIRRSPQVNLTPSFFEGHSLKSIRYDLGWVNATLSLLKKSMTIVWLEAMCIMKGLWSSRNVNLTCRTKYNDRPEWFRNNDLQGLLELVKIFQSLISRI